MRLTLISLAAIVFLFVLWLFAARSLTLLLDALHTTPIDSPPLTHFRYDSAVLELGATRLDFMTPDSLPTHVRAIISPAGLVSLVDGPNSFPLGPGRSIPQPSGLPCFEFTAGPGDTVRFTISRSMLSWPTPFETNFMTGVVPSWKRYVYCRLIWTKPSRAKLDILWRFEQAWFREGGWRPPKIEYGVSGFIRASFPKTS